MQRYKTLAIAERVLVNTRTGTAIEGILWMEHRGILVLRDAKLIQEGQSVTMDGEVYIAVAEIDFIQKPEVG